MAAVSGCTSRPPRPTSQFWALTVTQFQGPVITSLEIGDRFPRAIATADVNHDGKLDLAVSTCDHRSENNPTALIVCTSVSILLGRGDGSFDPPIEHTTAFQVEQMAFANLDEDGSPDLIAAPHVSVLR